MYQNSKKLDDSKHNLYMSVKSNQRTYDKCNIYLPANNGLIQFSSKTDVRIYNACKN